MVNNVPPEGTFSLRLGRNQMAYVAAAVRLGGNVRVGLEDNLWLDKGVHDQRTIGDPRQRHHRGMGARVIGPTEVRETALNKRRAPRADAMMRRRHVSRCCWCLGPAKKNWAQILNCAAARIGRAGKGKPRLCEGGRNARDQRFGIAICQMKTQDGGKSCSSSDDCEGFCQAEGQICTSESSPFRVL